MTRRAFDDPDRFDVGRVGQAPMSFGGGIHYCLGAALGTRAEGAVVFDRLLDRFPVIEPAWDDERPAYRDTIVLHGLESLPVRVRVEGRRYLAAAGSSEDARSD